jgi:histidine ammonia-lyase
MEMPNRAAGATHNTEIRPVVLGTSGVSAAEVVAVARHDAAVSLTPEAEAAMARCAEIVERLAESDQPAYGVTTGFGSLALVPIPPARREELQRSLIRSHAAGMGDPVEREVVRGMMLLRARTLAMGLSGTRSLVAERLVDLLNAGLTPVVPEHGSLGASGDLAPLAHCALALIGEGRLDRPDGVRRPAGEALEAAGIQPITLGPKEGLALINGTDGILAMLVLA